MNGYQGRKFNEIGDLIFTFHLWETFLSINAELGIFT